MKVQTKDLQNRLQQKECELEGLNTLLNTNHSEMISLKETISAPLCKEIESLSSSLNDAEKECVRLETLLTESEKQKEKFMEQVQQLEKINAELEVNSRELHETYEREQLKCVQFERDIDALTAELSDCNTSKDKLDQEFEIEVQKHAQDLLLQRELHDKLSQDLDIMHQREKDAIKEAKHLQEQFISVNEALDQAVQVKLMLEEQIASSEQDGAGLISENANLREELASTIKDKEGLEQRMNKMQIESLTANEQLQASTSKLEEEREVLSQRIVDLEIQINAHVQKQERLETEEQSAQTKLQTQIEATQIEIRDICSVRDALESHKNNLLRELDSVRSELASAQVCTLRYSFTE